MATALEQLACENPSENPIFASFAAPIRAIFGFSKHETLFIYAWIFLILIYIVVYYVLPLSILNSENGFLSGRRVFLSSLLIFFLCIVALVIWYRQTACDTKKAKAAYYVLGRRPEMPGYLSQATNRIQQQPEQRGRDVTPWKPQRP